MVLLRRVRRYAAAALLALAAAALAQPAPPEVQIKAAFLYKFGDFVEWPPEAFAETQGTFVIGVAGAAALAGELERVLSGRTVQDRSVKVRRVTPEEPLPPLHVLFVGEDRSERLDRLAAALAGRPVLIVTETENAMLRGSMINFVTERDRVRFDIALAPAERSSLRISARLLTVARRVVSKPS